MAGMGLHHSRNRGFHCAEGLAGLVPATFALVFISALGDTDQTVPKAFSPVLTDMAFQLGPAEYFSMMVVGLLAGATLAKGSAVMRFHFGVMELSDGLSRVAMAMGMFGVADILHNVNRMKSATTVDGSGKVSMRSLRPRRDRRHCLARGGDQRRHADRVTQTGFIPTMNLGILGEPAMALMLDALIIHGIQPGPQMVVEYANIFWGLIANFWVGSRTLPCWSSTCR